jgi:hypothetical protein
VQLPGQPADHPVIWSLSNVGTLPLPISWSGLGADDQVLPKAFTRVVPPFGRPVGVRQMVRLAKRAHCATASGRRDALGIAGRPVSTGPRRACRLPFFLTR